MTQQHASRAPRVDLAADLSRVDAYGPSTPTRHVHMVETHASRVFLLDHDVFKTKRAVDLGFLDFRTVAARKAACEMELVVNARLAPGVYQGVVPVRRGPDGRASLSADGPIVDWAVHMRRLADDARADVRLAEGRLTGDDIDRIAVRLAIFHREARTDAETTRMGDVLHIERNLEESFEQTASSLRDHLSGPQADELVRWQRAFLRANAPLFEKRAVTGHVRDGHGDLRLEHVYLQGGDVTVIDGVEFSDRLRFGDVCSDLAFLSMDLANHGRVDLAERLLASYARETSDFELYGLVDFYESYRAFVRGKIAAMLARDPALPATRRTGAAERARRYFLLALSSDRRSLLVPALVAVGGVIASGKSTFAAALAAGASAPVIEADRLRKAMLGVPIAVHLDHASFHGAYDPRVTQRVYQAILHAADSVLASGRPVVLDASFRSASMRSAARELAQRHGVPFRFFECRAPREVCLERLSRRARTASVSDGRAEVFDDFVRRYESVRELPSPDHLVVDTTLPLAENLARAQVQVDSWPRGFWS